MSTIKRMDLQEFRDAGYLLEANRLFFHPLGLALEVECDKREDGTVEVHRLGGIWDYRDDPEGMMFGEFEPGDAARAAAIARLRASKVEARRALGFGDDGVEPIP